MGYVNGKAMNSSWFDLLCTFDKRNSPGLVSIPVKGLADLRRPEDRPSSMLSGKLLTTEVEKSLSKPCFPNNFGPRLEIWRCLYKDRLFFENLSEQPADVYGIAHMGNGIACDDSSRSGIQQVTISVACEDGVDADADGRA